MCSYTNIEFLALNCYKKHLITLNIYYFYRYVEEPTGVSMIKVVWNIVKKIFGIFCIILSPLKRLWCRRKRRNSDTILPLTNHYSVPSDFKQAPTPIQVTTHHIAIMNCPFRFAFSHLPRCWQLLTQKHRNNFAWYLCASFSYIFLFHSSKRNQSISLIYEFTRLARIR